MENNELKTLISTFKEYRDLLTPIEQNLKEFSISFENISGDIKNLNNSFSGTMPEKLNQICKELATQVEKAKTLSNQVDSFMGSTNRYISSVDRLISICSRIEEKIGVVDNIEKQAEQQIEKLETIIEEKKKTYDIKQLERKLETYNTGVQKVSEYINKDVADTLKENSDKINSIQDKNNIVYRTLLQEKESIDKLVGSYETTNELLKKVVENNDVNEQYIFEILDKWAMSRKVKTKK